MNARSLVLPLAAAAAMLASSCAPADFSGDYTVNYTNGENGCSLDGWTVGASTTGIPVAFTQSDSAVTATVGGLTGIYLDLTMGGHDLTGNVTMDDVTARLLGKFARSQGSCAYTWSLEMRGHLDGDAISGKLRYTADTNDSADCGSLKNCESVMDFNGTRPPKAK